MCVEDRGQLSSTCGCMFGFRNKLSAGSKSAIQADAWSQLLPASILNDLANIKCRGFSSSSATCRNIGTCLGFVTRETIPYAISGSCVIKSPCSLFPTNTAVMSSWRPLVSHRTLTLTIEPLVWYSTCCVSGASK